jgi:hypothetical protein
MRVLSHGGYVPAGKHGPTMPSELAESCGGPGHRGHGRGLEESKGSYLGRGVGEGLASGPGSGGLHVLASGAGAGAGKISVRKFWGCG